MHNLQSILLATDFRPASLEAARSVARLSSVCGSRVTLLHVIESMPKWLYDKLSCAEAAASQLREIRVRLAANQVAITESATHLGSPAETIVRQAGRMDADLIVIGAGERWPDQSFSPGPVAEAILQHATQPVLAVRPGLPALAFESIVCPVDFSDVSRRALENAIRLAGAMHCSLVVLSVVPPVHWLSAAIGTGEFTGVKAQHERNWQLSFDRFLEGVDFGQTDWSREVRSGPVHEQIVAAVRENQADLLVMGTHGHGRLARTVMGSVARRVLRQLPCSLLAVKGTDMLSERFEEDLQVRQLLMAEAREFEASGQHATAAYKYGQALAIDPFHVPALLARAESCERIGDLEESTRLRDRARRLLHDAEP